MSRLGCQRNSLQGSHHYGTLEPNSLAAQEPETYFCRKVGTPLVHWNFWKRSSAAKNMVLLLNILKGYLVKHVQTNVDVNVDKWLIIVR